MYGNKNASSWRSQVLSYRGDITLKKLLTIKPSHDAVCPAWNSSRAKSLEASEEHGIHGRAHRRGYRFGRSCVAFESDDGALLVTTLHEPVSAIYGVKRHRLPFLAGGTALLPPNRSS